MSRESLEELRERLLRDEQAQELIRMRAFEIYKLRGGQSGGEAHDWFQAESEVLTFLIEEESRQASDSKAAGAATEPAEAGSKAPSAVHGKPAKLAAPKPTARKAKEATAEKTTSKRTSKKAVDSAPKSRGKKNRD